MERSVGGDERGMNGKEKEDGKEDVVEEERGTSLGQRLGDGTVAEF
jgi:hypothetical protein